MDDKTLVERAVDVPLLERLRRVPPDARLEYEHDPCHHSLFPIGFLCKEAATRIEALEAALRRMIYETTHLSPMKPNGDHDCTIKADALEQARQALESQP